MKYLKVLSFLVITALATFGSLRLQFQSPLKAVQYQTSIDRPVALPEFALDDRIDAREAFYAKLNGEQ